jgi:hypothetical protein
MACSRCDSYNRQNFNSELAIHFPGRDGPKKPTVLVWPELTVCMNCGFTEFTIPEKQLKVLLKGSAENSQ